MKNKTSTPIHRVPYPIPISLFLFIIGAEQDAAEQSGFMEDSYIKKQRYRDGVWNSMDGDGSLVSLVFHNLPSLYPSSFRRNDFHTCFTKFFMGQAP